MSTSKQCEASRRNGASSRGPVTPEGKARSARNAVTHGLYSRVVVLQNESHDLYAALRESYIREWEPVGERELHLVEDMVNARWRLNRILTFETAALDLEMDRQRSSPAAQQLVVDEATRATLAFNALATEGAGLTMLQRYESRLRRALDRSAAALERLQSRRTAEKIKNEETNPSQGKQLP